MTKNERYAIHLGRSFVQMIRSMYDVMPNALCVLVFLKTLFGSLLVDYAKRRLLCRKKEIPTLEEFTEETNLLISMKRFYKN